MKKGMLIGELSRRVDVPPHTIRYYERLGLINPPERTESKYRVYSEEDEARPFGPKIYNLLNLVEREAETFSLLNES